jgi:hypothetical protein
VFGVAPKSRSAEGAALCRGLGCPQLFLFLSPPQAASLKEWRHPYVSFYVV